MNLRAIELLPLVVALIVMAGREVMNAHRRSLANRALHEVRRPLQALALSLPAGPGRMTPVLPVWQAIKALAEVDRQINGGAPDELRPEPIACRLMTEACVRRWQSRARMAGGGIELRWVGPEALVTGDPAALSAAIENLIVNAIEHGGPRIAVRCLVVGQRLRLEVSDNGSDERPANRGRTPAEVMARLRGRERHHHGLAVVRTAVKAHKGRFEIKIEHSGSVATIVLPCVTRAPEPIAGVLEVKA